MKFILYRPTHRKNEYFHVVFFFKDAITARAPEAKEAMFAPLPRFLRLLGALFEF